MTVSMMERFATAGVALVLTADMLLVAGIAAESEGMMYAIAVFVIIGFLTAAVTLVMELRGKHAGGVAWTGAGLLIFGLFGLFLAYLMLICRVDLPREVPLAIASVGAFPLLAATYFFGALWFPKGNVGMSVGFGIGQLLWAIGNIVRFTGHSLFQFYCGSALLIVGTLTMNIIFAVGQSHRAKLGKSSMAGVLVATKPAETYGTV